VLVGVTVGKDDADVRHLLAARASRTASGGLEALQYRAVFNHGALYGERISREVVVVLGVRDGALERLGDEARGFAADDREQIDRGRGLEALNGADNFGASFLETCARSG